MESSRLIDPRATIEFTIAASGVGLTVDVQLRDAGDRWVARVTAPPDRAQIALGRSPSDALASALAPFGSHAVKRMLADTALLDPSVRVRKVRSRV